MSENGLPVYGPAASVLPGRRWSTLFPMRKSVYYKFGNEAAESAATIALYGMIPFGLEVDEEVPLEFTVTEQYNMRIPGEPEMILVRVVAQLKETKDA